MMKQMKSVHTSQKICLALVLTLLLLLTAVLPVMAAEDASEREVIQWSEFGDGSITDGERVLAPYPLLPGFKVDARNRYLFDAPDNAAWDKYFFIAAARDGDILWTRGSDTTLMYVTDESRVRINALVAGTALDGSFRQLNFKDHTGLTPGKTEALAEIAAAGGSTEAVEVKHLYNVTRYEVRRYEASGVIYTVDALLFRVFDGDGSGLAAGQFGYLDLTALDNSHFDANGDFSFRSGAVTLTVFDADSEAGEAISDLLAEMTELENRTVWQTDDLFGSDDDFDFGKGGVIFFWITLVFFGFLLPLLPLVLGLIFALTGAKKKRWLLLSAAALIWLLCALCLVLILA